MVGSSSNHLAAVWVQHLSCHVGRIRAGKKEMAGSNLIRLARSLQVATVPCSWNFSRRLIDVLGSGVAAASRVCVPGYSPLALISTGLAARVISSGEYLH
jgi:hypothetical protein